MSGHDHPHDHGHGHDHPHDHGPFQPDIEDRPLTHHQAMTEAVADLLLAKGIIEPVELRKMLEAIDAKSPAAGSKMVAKAWTDPGFKQRMLADVIAAASELDIDAGGIPIKAIENTQATHNVVVCTLCSCYPRLLIGLPPDWYKARAYRSRVIREPRAVLKEFGTEIPDDVEVRVHDSTADLRYLIIPRRPAGTEGWSAEKLEALVTRDTMIGVALPQV
ncbi:MAG: nitrile hydratase subunit alpha [Oceanibaculum nanhaiense]|uniref:nitrile hydratase subunit alpha n=1 Tax=Oceanibaculum nanhaiense TaxID=1909734 RepID=UPI0025A4839B|nr:nitrile hydratase subunit alpha [Oceanibaculum nanhaiense]MDM7944997.1 nitrile hydratase subunit alpha [Oceanibaculum nanhaiense]